MSEKPPNITWSEEQCKAAEMLAEGHTIKETAKAVGVDSRTIDRWKTNDMFSQEVDRLSLMLGIAQKAERLRIAKRVVRQRTRGTTIRTKRDLLDWLKYAQSETDGIKLDLTGDLARELAAFLAQTSTMAGSGQSGVADEDGNGA
jgi:transposase-like protein